MNRVANEPSTVGETSFGAFKVAAEIVATAAQHAARKS